MELYAAPQADLITCTARAPARALYRNEPAFDGEA